jgi:hypothetical protein
MIPRLKLRLLAASGTVLISFALAPHLLAQAELFDRNGFAPVSREELALKDNPLYPGASAMILYRDVSLDDNDGLYRVYFRIKVFSEEGTEFANVEVPFIGARGISDVHARTIHPDGSIANFAGEVYEKMVVKGKGVRIRSEAFTLPDVRAGSVIEYGYTHRWGKGYMSEDALDSTVVDRWIIDDELFTRHAHFSFRPVNGATASLVWQRLPKGHTPQKQKNGTVTLDVTNVPPFLREQFMPPEYTVRSLVEFYYVLYTAASSQDSREFWVDQGKDWAKAEDAFIGKHKAIEGRARELVGADDPPEAKLRKLYAEAQKIRNLSFESQKTAQEEKREKLKENRNVEDVLEHGYGYGRQINALFAALALASGFNAYPILAVSRNVSFFNPDLHKWGQLNSNVVEVDVGAKKLYLDPATPSCPFGLLPWQESGVKGVRLDKRGGVVVATSEPVSSDAVTERKAALQWVEGTLTGKVEVSFRGQEALERRLANREEDEAGRRKKLEDEVKGWLPVGATVRQVSATGWDSSEQSLRASFEIQAPSFGMSTQRRLLFPIAIFQANSENPFQHADRIHAVYFSFPWQEVDDIHIELPKGYVVEVLPPPNKAEREFGHYEISSAKEASGVHIQRKFVMDGLILDTGHYASLRALYSEVGAGDEQLLVLRATEVGAKP